jgi:hypothetical protein
VRGRRFWSVYIAKPGSKNAKEIRVDAISGQILAVQTENQEIRPKSLRKTVERLASGEGFSRCITKSRKTLIEYQRANAAIRMRGKLLPTYYKSVERRGAMIAGTPNEI